MATKLDVLDAIHDVLAETITDAVDGDVTDPYTHVRLTEQTEDADTRLPAYTLEAFTSDITVGMTGDLQTASSDVTGTTATTTQVRQKELTLDIAAHAAGDNARRVNALYEAAETAMVPFVDDPDTLHSDVEAVDIDGTTDVSSPDTATRGDRLRVTIEYERYFERTDTVMDDIDVTVRVDENNTSSTDETGSAIDVSYVAEK